MRVSIATRWAEGFGAGAAAGLLGLLDKTDPAFSGMGFLPQALASVLVASLLGTVPGALALAGAALATAALPAVGGLLGVAWAFPLPRELFEAARVPAALILLCALAAGWLRDGSTHSTKRLLGRLREVVRRNAQMRRMNAGLSELSEELQLRVAGQRDSVSALYARIRKMDSQDMDKVMSGLLDAVVAFSQASSAAVYEYEPRSERLVRLASIGEEAEPVLRLDDSLEGWVFRNNSPFSLRNVDDYLNLSGVDFKKSVLAYPLKAGDLPWGVLNVSEMPFYRYNPVTEKNLGVVLNLASSYVKKAVDFRDRVLRRPRNEITGLPGYGEFLRILGEEIARREGRRISVSVIIAEILDFEKLAFEHSGFRAFGFLKQFAEAAVAGQEVMAFHYRADGQLAFILPDIDRDGASLFCLGLSGIAGERVWLIDGQTMRVEVAFGLAAFQGSALVAPPPPAELAGEPEALLSEAESVLFRSKAVFLEHGGPPA